MALPGNPPPSRYGPELMTGDQRGSFHLGWISIVSPPSGRITAHHPTLRRRHQLSVTSCFSSVVGIHSPTFPFFVTTLRSYLYHFSQTLMHGVSGDRHHEDETRWKQMSVAAPQSERSQMGLQVRHRVPNRPDPVHENYNK